MRVYLDSCCYNRPFDDLSQEVVHIESEAVLNTLAKGLAGEYEIIGSDALEYELYQISDIAKRQNVLDLYYDNVKIQIEETDEINTRAKKIREDSNIHFFDSLQIAYAEAGGAEVMLTTDYKLEKMASHILLKVRVVNPVKFFLEEIYGT
ncbi:MAG: PIN domain-containing protein [Oscillospiraceae bacterium]|nr:PIN domain-containing protein [Oscillospiraceae bacterium]